MSSVNYQQESWAVYRPIQLAPLVSATNKALKPIKIKKRKFKKKSIAPVQNQT